MNNDIETLTERVDKLRHILEQIRDRDPQKETPGGATIATYVSYTEQTRQHAMRALQHDDVLSRRVSI